MSVWTEAEDEKLRSMRKEGKSFAYCAAHLPGRNRSACLGRAHRLKLPSVTPDVGARRAARIAKHAKPGRRIPTRGNGLPPRNLDDREHAIDDLCLIALDHLSAGWTPAELAEVLGVAAAELVALWTEVQTEAATEQQDRKRA